MPDGFCSYPDFLSGSSSFDCFVLANALFPCSECPWYVEDVSLLEV